MDFALSLDNTISLMGILILSWCSTWADVFINVIHQHISLSLDDNIYISITSEMTSCLLASTICVAIIYGIQESRHSCPKQRCVYHDLGSKAHCTVHPSHWYNILHYNILYILSLHWAGNTSYVHLALDHVTYFISNI